MNLSLGGMALATLPPLVFALALLFLLRQRSLADFYARLCAGWPDQLRAEHAADAHLGRMD